MTAITIATTIFLPAGRHDFWWPLLLLFAILAIGGSSAATNGRLKIRRAILALVALTLATARLAPSFAASADGTAQRFLISGGLTAVSLFGLYIPYLDFLTAGRRWIVPSILGAVAIVNDRQGQRRQQLRRVRTRIPTASFIFRTPIARVRDGSAWIRGPILSPRNFSSITCAADGCRNSPGSRPETRRTTTSRASRAISHI